jgi:hypothetical protein
MKTIFLIPAIGLSATYFLKAQGANVLAYNPVEISVSMTKDSTQFQEYCGTYTMKNNPYIDEITIHLKQGKLISITPEGEEVVLENTGNDEFFVAFFNARIIFTRINSIVKGVKALVKGQEMVGLKQ